jgi:hypothetical protein
MGDRIQRAQDVEALAAGWRSEEDARQGPEKAQEGS